MKCLYLLCVTFGLAVAATRWHELDGYTFEQYRAEFHKYYDDAEGELEYRRLLFEDKLAKIRSHNADSTQSWKMGVNQFTDRTHKEFSRVLGLRKDLLYATKLDQLESAEVMVDISSLPLSVDWRKEGIISTVKDQGECGSCWSFGTAETIESYYALDTGMLPMLSEQQILDCTPNPNQCGGTGGCGGGTPELAYAKIQQLGGLAAEWTYPYVSYFGDDQSCQIDNNQRSFMPIVAVANWTVLPSNNYNAVINHIATIGPLAVNVDASSWADYETGVYSGCNQISPDIDHVVQLVGYGTDPQYGQYWTIRNSWNPSYGEDGYIRLTRNPAVPCGVDMTPSDGTGCNNGPANVTVCGECGILYDTSFPQVMTA